MSAAPPPRRIAVVGGGITGLAAAHRLRERATDAVEVVVFEAAARPGGVIASRRADDFLIEDGPDSFITDKPWARELAVRLGLEPRLIEVRPEFRRSFVWRGGRLHPTPLGFQLLAPSRLASLWTSSLFSPWGRLRMALEPWIPPRRGGGDESLASFVRRRLGGEALERIASPMVAGIYGADPERLSLAATFPRFLEMERSHGSVVRALAARARDREASGARYGLFASLDEGVQVLVDALAARQPAGGLRCNRPVERLEQDGSGGWSVRAGAVERFEQIVLAVAAPNAADLVRGFDRELAARLEALPRGSSANVSLGYEAAALPRLPAGSGFVVAGDAGWPVLGCTFSHQKFAGRAPAGAGLFRVFFREPLAGEAEPTLISEARRMLEVALGVRGTPRIASAARWPRAMPHYEVGHLERVAALRARAATHRGLHLAGSSFDGVGLPDCVHSGESAAEAVLAGAPAPATSE